jgi:hypothetical protein
MFACSCYEEEREEDEGTQDTKSDRPSNLLNMIHCTGKKGEINPLNLRVHFSNSIDSFCYVPSHVKELFLQDV